MRLIDADALSKRILFACNNDAFNCTLLGKMVLDAIDAQPTITDKEVIAEFLKQGTFKIHIPEVEPFIEPVKRGRWKPFDLTWGRSVYACTSCGEAFEVPTEMGKPIFIYCPNCGAKMKNT